MEYERTADLELVRRIITHPKIYDWCGDDFAPAPADFRPREEEQIWYVLVRDRGELLGMLMFVGQSQVCWDVHVCMLPSAWGRRTAKAAVGGFRWIFEHTTARRIVATVPDYNRCASWLAVRAGMETFGLNKAAWLKHGKLHDLILFGISKEA